MKVSVIIPTYNRSPVLKRTLEAVLSQTYRDLEAIVIDDGSTDDTGIMIAGIGDPRLVYRRIPNSGRPATPRNVGLGVAGGQLIAFCDDDDLWSADKLRLQVDFLEKNPAYGLVCSNADGFPGESGLEITLDGLLKVNSIIISSVLARRSALDAAGRFDEDMRLRAVEDFDFWIRVLHLSGSKAYRLPERLLHYNRETDGIGRNATLEGRKDTYRKVIRVLDKAGRMPGLEARARRARRYQIRSLISTLQYFRYRRTFGYLLDLWKSACLPGTKVKLTLRWAGVPLRSMADADFWSRPAGPGTGSPAGTGPAA